MQLSVLSLAPAVGMEPGPTPPASHCVLDLIRRCFTLDKGQDDCGSVVWSRTVPEALLSLSPRGHSLLHPGTHKLQLTGSCPGTRGLLALGFCSFGMDVAPSKDWREHEQSPATFLNLC